MAANKNHRIIIAGQNETIRKHAGEKIDLCTLGLIGCVAVIIQDKKGNASLTHVDLYTDLSFIRDETTSMDGVYTIDVVRIEPNQSDLADKVQNYVKGEFKGVTNSKGNFDERKSKNGTVLLRDGGMKTPLAIHIQQVATPGFIVPKENPLKGDNAELGSSSKGFQTRIYERQIENCFLKGEQKPTVTYDQDWKGNFPKLSDASGSALAALEKVRNNPLQFLQTLKGHSKSQDISALQQEATTISRYFTMQQPQQGVNL